MAKSLLSPHLAAPSVTANREPSVTAASFLHGTKLSFPPTAAAAAGRRWRFKSPAAAAKKNLDHIPKQFREENLKEGLMDNYKNVPRKLYGLTPSQMEMFMTEDNPVCRQSESVTEESLSSISSYRKIGGMWSLSGTTGRGPAECSMSASMFGGAGGYAKAGTAPPDLPSLMLDARVIYLGMPIVPAVTELLVAQFLYLDYEDCSKPIYLYINSPGTQNEKRETIASETQAYAIADCINCCTSDVYTVNVGMAYGQAGMLLSLGKKGFRGLQMNASTKLYLPKVHRSSGAAIEMWIKAKELDTNTDYFLELLAQGIGKPKEEIAEYIKRPKYFTAQKAIDYGIADKLLTSFGSAYDKRDYDGMYAQSKAAMRAPGAGPQAAPSGGIW